MSILAEILDHKQTEIAALDGPAPILPGMANYHLGFADAEFRPAVLTAAQRGKRLRPGIAMLACSAAGGTAERAVPLAAAIELLHNFTLVHDDIQDQSPSRRHRPTVWTLWGAGLDALKWGAVLLLVGGLIYGLMRLISPTAPAANPAASPESAA